MLERRRNSARLLSLTFATCMVCAAASADIDPSAPEHSQPPPLSALIDSTGSDPALSPEARAKIREFYSARDFLPVWCDAAGLGPHAQTLVEALRAAPLQGVQLTAAQHRALSRIPAAGAGFDCAATDLLLTEAFYELAIHLGRGQLVPTDIDPLWHYPLPQVDVKVLLDAVAAGGDVDRILNSVAPQSPEYAGLVGLLARYRAIAAAGGWPRLAEKGATLHLGDDSEEVPVLRQRLIITGDLAESAVEGAVFDQDLEIAVKHFQQRHGLETDGVVGKKTRAVLNVPVEDRIGQILLNLERWRWLPRSFGRRYVWVNTADFSLSLHDGDQTPRSMRVIVGREERETPAFSEPMTHLVFNPSWSVPNKIAVEDLLPKQMHDPGYIGRKRIHVLSNWSDNAVELDPYAVNWHAYRNAKTLPFKFEQDSGPDNSLGRIKFLMPNPYSVYLHDTPSRNLFSRATRAFSSGCIRVEDPTTLAEFALGEQWDGKSVAALVEAGRTQYVRLPEPLPVYLVYLTGWQDDAGLAQFRDDIYKLDRRLAPALEALGPADVDHAELGEGLIASPLTLLGP